MQRCKSTDCRPNLPDAQYGYPAYVYKNVTSFEQVKYQLRQDGPNGLNFSVFVLESLGFLSSVRSINVNNGEGLSIIYNGKFIKHGVNGNGQPTEWTDKELRNLKELLIKYEVALTFNGTPV